MKKLKVLFVTHNFSRHIEKSSYYLSQELAKQCDLMLWHDHGPIEYIVNQCRERPDFVLLNDFKPDYCPFVRKLHRCPVPYGVIMHDLKYKIPQRKRYIEKENIQYIFSIYKRPFLKYFPEFSNRLRWFPHHVPTHIFNNKGLTRPIPWLFAGKTFARLYPFREKILQAMRHEKGFQQIGHPGYRDIKPNEKHAIVGQRYAQLLNQAKMLLTCDSADHFALLKYYEAAACGTLVLSPLNPELEELGFRHNETLVNINENNIKASAYHWLTESGERERIVKAGAEMVRERHSTERRVQELLGYIRQIIH